MKKVIENKAVQFILAGIVAYITARATVSGILSPFNIILCSAGGIFLSLGILTGTLISYLLGGLVGDAIVYIIALLMCVIISIISPNKTAKSTAVTTFTATVTGVIAVGIYVHSVFGQFFTGFVISLFTGAATYFFKEFFDYYKLNKEISLEGKHGIELVVVFITVTLTLCSFELFYVNLGILFSIFIIFQAINKSGAIGGLICGAFANFAVYLYNAEIGTLFIVIPLLSFLMGSLPKMKKIVLVSIFMAANIVIFIMSGINHESITLLTSFTFGCGLYLYVPIGEIIFENTTVSLETYVQNLLTQKLRFISNSMLHIKEEAQSVCRVLSKNQTYNRLKDIQNVFFGQMEISAELIVDIEKKINNTDMYDLAIIYRITQVFKHKKIEFETLSAYYNASGRLFIEIFTENEYNNEELAEIIAEELDMKIGYLNTVNAYNIKRLVFTSMPKYSLKYATYQKACSDVNGDNFKIFYNDTGQAFLALSDGMGTGKRASIESRMLLSHCKRLIKSGIDDIELTVKMVNYMMNVKSTEDIFATLDLVKIDMDTGDTTFYKYGASSTILKHDNNITIITEKSMPVGIINDLETSKNNFKLETGDILILLSDGIADEQYVNIKNLLLKAKKDVKYMAKEICRMASLDATDDVTVIVAEITA